MPRPETKLLDALRLTLDADALSGHALNVLYQDDPLDRFDTSTPTPPIRAAGHRIVAHYLDSLALAMDTILDMRGGDVRISGGDATCLWSIRQTATRQAQLHRSHARRLEPSITASLPCDSQTED